MAAPQTHHEPAGNGFGLVHRVAQSPLGDLWLALDQRRGAPEPVLLRYVLLSGGATRDTLERVASAGRAAMSLRSELLLPVVEVLKQRPLAVAYQYTEAQPLSVLQSCARARELLFPVSVSLRLAVDLLRALQFVHESWPGWPTDAPFGGLLPASVLIGRDGRTRLCDALVASSALLQRGFELSAAELAYRAPEQVYASTAPEPATDVFIAAVLLWELLSGRRMLSGRKETIERKLLEHDLPRATADLRSDCQLSRGLLELVNSGLSLDPSQRPGSPGAFAIALERCGHEVASHEEVAAFVQELVGPQLDRAALILRLALGYAGSADDARAAATASPREIAAAQADLAAAQADLAAAPPGSEHPDSDVTTVKRRDDRPSTVAPPPSSPASVPPPLPGAPATRSLAAQLALTFARHRASEVPPPPTAGAPRATSLGIGATPRAQSAAPASTPSASTPALTAPAGTAQPPGTAAQPPVQVMPVLPLHASVPPMPLLRRRADAEPASDGAPPVSDEQPTSSQEQTTVQGTVRQHGAVRSYSPPPEPIRLAPKRALLAAMASVVLLLQLWMFDMVRSQPRKAEPDAPGAEQSQEPAEPIVQPSGEGRRRSPRPDESQLVERRSQAAGKERRGEAP